MNQVLLNVGKEALNPKKIVLPVVVVRMYLDHILTNSSEGILFASNTIEPLAGHLSSSFSIKKTKINPDNSITHCTERKKPCPAQ
jgi:hypothetical protein